ncbi:GntR family transcriptional regulator [Devosia faecipullorum]|uniref:GntR family transcriptional regulator n=1 Tax=Devosia faecipullorum TaxID=2755039 RepID=UPI00187BA87A|nr:GntR family transcriptional regulator [Devosia faecipullorum]MBE7733316.1 GntR family transcriptional regulator [Devosia faecipullorum]
MDEEREEPQQLTQVVYDLLRTHLDARALPEGLVLGEAAISRALSVSRTPVRSALEQLLAQQRVVTHAGRGMLVSYGNKAPEPLRLDLVDAGLQVPETDDFGFSGGAERIYPDVEKVLSSCAAFGRFHVNQTAMASFYGTSRTVASVVLNQLEHVGLVRQDRHARWYVERLTAQRAAEHYSIRQLLEPEALRLAAPTIDQGFLRQCWERLVTAMQRGIHADLALIDQIERDLHFDIVHRCPNAQLVKIINESQRPLISTSYTIERYHDIEVTHGTLPQHLNVMNSLLEGNFDRAGEALRYHLEQASKVNIPRLEKLPPLDADRYPPYLTPTS